ncbi:hypothetical protein HOY80DRAFT_1093383 [Tuber brumale]|nr:hypothetical protein HOY80DRAFT_1093383 [Tuber brumale]
MMVPIFFGLGLVSGAPLGFAIPVPQFQDPWGGFFVPEQPCDPPDNRPYGTYAVQAPPLYPCDPQPYYVHLPPPSTPTPYAPGTLEKPMHPAGAKPELLPPNGGPPNYVPTYGPSPPTVNAPPFRPYAPHPHVSQALPPSARPPPPPAGAVDGAIAEEASRKQKPKPPLTERLPAPKDAAEPATGAPPTNERVAAKKNEPTGSTGEGSTEENAMRYHVNVGGVQKGAGGGTTNFHVYTDENGTKKFSDELDPETEKYITENMIPKLGNRRKKGGGVWSVFGGK